MRNRVSAFSGEVTCLAFSPDGKQLATATAGPAAVKLWDIGKGKEIMTLEAATAVQHLAFSPDGQLLATGHGGAAGEVRLWDATTGQERALLLGNGNAVSWVSFAGANGPVATAGKDGTMRLWDLTPQRVMPLPAAPKQEN
jgi:WD40 repeat protein